MPLLADVPHKWDFVYVAYSSDISSTTNMPGSRPVMSGIPQNDSIFRPTISERLSLTLSSLSIVGRQRRRQHLGDPMARCRQPDQDGADHFLARCARLLGRLHMKGHATLQP
jgi:hypothetical protein